jgi:predicted nucleic acid-binding protein
VNPDGDKVMIKAVLDANILISSFISSLFTGGGLSSEIFQLAKIGKFHLYTATSILEETRSILLEESRILRKYSYTKDDVDEFIMITIK